MKIIHVFTEQGLLLKDKQVEDSYQLSANESLSLPKNVTYSINYQPIAETVDAPSEQQMLSQLALQQAQFQASQQKLNSQLALQLAQIIAKEAQNV